MGKTASGASHHGKVNIQTSIKSPKKRRRRGGRNRKRKNSEQTSSAEITQSTKSSTEPLTVALQVDWFDAEGGMTNESYIRNVSIPPPLELSDLEKVEEDTSQETTSTTETSTGSRQQLIADLATIWRHYCKKRQKQQHNYNQPWNPTPVQLQSWSILLPSPASSSSSPNLIGLSPTGSGKTASFAAPMVVEAAAKTSTINKTYNNKLFGLVLVPTRELALQVSKEVQVLLTCCENQNQADAVRVMACYGGSNRSTEEQLGVIRNSPPSCQWIVSATPGRFWDMVEQSKGNTNDGSWCFMPHYIVLDEADRLAQNSDLRQQVASILEACMSPRTVLALFSATYPSKVRDQWKAWMKLGDRDNETEEIKPCIMIRVDAISMANKSPSKKLKTSQTNDDKAAKSANNEAGSPSTADDDDDKQQKPGANKSSTQQNHDHSQDTTTDEADHQHQSFENIYSKIPAHLVQTLHVCAEHKKPKKLMTTLLKIRSQESKGNARQKALGIIFFARIKTLQYVYKLLKKDTNHSCLELHSQMPQRVREQAVQSFRCGKVPLLLATDMAARGFHVPNVSFVINYDFPGNLEHFFTRSLAPMAADVVSLLKATNQWVDPNLEALVGADLKTKHKPGNSRDPKDQNPCESENPDQQAAKDDDDSDHWSDEDQDAFPELTPNRIVLKRAQHVSDASSDDESSDENN